MNTLFETKKKEFKGAHFSECGLYRYSLWRVWDESKPLVMFIGLNPSKADSKEDDNTIKRVRAIAEFNGFGGFYMCNCYSYISTNPKMLKMETLDAMMENARHISSCAQGVSEVVFAWGNFKQVTKELSDKLRAKFPNAKALHINNSGSPKHPLFCRAKSPLIPFNPITPKP